MADVVARILCGVVDPVVCDSCEAMYVFGPMLPTTPVLMILELMLSDEVEETKESTDTRHKSQSRLAEKNLHLEDPKVSSSLAHSEGLLVLTPLNFGKVKDA